MSAGEVLAYPDFGANLAQGAVIRNATISERLEAEKKLLEGRLAEVNKALTALQEKPEIAELLNVVAKVAGRF